MVLNNDNLIRTAGGASLFFLSYGVNRLIKNTNDLDRCGKANVNLGLAATALTGVLISYSGVRSLLN